MQTRSLKLVKPEEKQPSAAEQALEEIAQIRQGLNSLERLTAEILAEKRRGLDRIEAALRASTGEEPPQQVA